MGIRIPEKNAVISGECIQCMQCLSLCPKESLSASPAGAIAGTVAAAAIGGTVIAGNLISFPVTKTVSDQQVTEKRKKGTIKTVFTQARGKAKRREEMISVTFTAAIIWKHTV